MSALGVHGIVLRHNVGQWDESIVKADDNERCLLEDLSALAEAPRLLRGAIVADHGRPT
jgi:hypothetical protein